MLWNGSVWGVMGVVISYSDGVVVGDARSMLVM